MRLTIAQMKGILYLCKVEMYIEIYTFLQIMEILMYILEIEHFIVKII